MNAAGPRLRRAARRWALVGEAAVADRVDVVKEPMKAAPRQAPSNLRSGESQRVQLCPRYDATLAARYAGQVAFAAMVFCITMRQFTIAHWATMAGKAALGR